MFYRGMRIINVTERPDMLAVQVRTESPDGRRIEHMITMDEWRDIDDPIRQHHERHIFEEERMEHSQRQSIRRMEMTINPPLMFGGSGGSGGAGGGGGGYSFEAIREMSQRSFGIDPTMFRNDKPESKMPEYSEEKFDSMGKEPVVKEIMSGMVKLTKEQSSERIRLHLER